MRDDQKICCNVKTCAYNNEQSQLCELKKITVCACNPCTSRDVHKPEDSMCASFETK